MKNEILQDVWRNRDAFAKAYNYDIDAMVAALQEMEKHPLTAVVDRRSRMAAEQSNSPIERTNKPKR